MSRTLESDKIDGMSIPPTIGTGIEFDLVLNHAGDIGEKVITYLFEKNEMREGNRIITLELTSWVGVSIGATHSYARMRWGGCSYRRLDGTNFETHSYPNGMPEVAESTEVEIRRPVTKRDIQYSKDQREEAFMRPKIGSSTRGFWTEAEAKDYSIRFFLRTFAPGRVLMGHDREGNQIELARTAATEPIIAVTPAYDPEAAKRTHRDRKTFQHRNRKP